MNKLEYWKNQNERFNNYKSHVIGRAQSLAIISGAQGIYLLQNIKTGWLMYVALITYIIAASNAFLAICEPEKHYLFSYHTGKDEAPSTKPLADYYELSARKQKEDYEIRSKAIHYSIAYLVITFGLFLINAIL